MNTEETGQEFGQNAEIQKKLDRTLIKVQEYRLNCTGRLSKWKKTEETRQDFGQNAGIPKKMERILVIMQEYRRNWTRH